VKLLMRSVLFVLPAVVGAQTPSAPAPAPSGPDSSARATAIRAAQAPVIDGRETDDVWRSAPITSDFREFQPKEGGPARFRTEFKAAYDDRNLFVFVRMFDPRPDSIMRALSRRDVRGSSDQIKLMIDSYFDRRNGYEFAVNPDGVKRDYAIYNDRDEDESWDAIWDVGTRIDSAGWTAEFRIPLSQMRYANRENHTFGFAIWRDIERYKERTSWPTYLSTRNGLTSQLGRLEGITGISSPRRLEMTPYTVSKSASRRVGGAVGYDRVENVTAGADVKYGITPNVMLDATVNPDFGQVEADPSVLNLTAFETFFQEKRPFFVEGVGLYSFGLNCNVVNCGGEGLFYSRRIGRQPQLLNRYGGVGSPTSTPILGAGKLTGRFPGGLSVGVLEAVTKEVAGPPATTGGEQRTMEPLTSYTVARLQQEFNGGGTTIGAIGTAVHRSLDEWTEDFLRKSAYVGGADLRHKFGASGYELNMSAMASTVTGDAAVIAATQRDPVHNYLRPDANLGYDPMRTSLSGHAQEIKFGKFAGELTRFETSYGRRSPGFEVNDLGFMRRADEQQQATWFALQFRKPNKVFRSFQMNFNEWLFWNTDGLKTGTGFNTNWHMNTTNNFWLHLGGTINQLGSFCDACTRGGPTIRRSPMLDFFAGVNMDDRWKVTPHLFFGGGRGDYGASGFYWIDPSVEIRPTSATQLSIGFSYNKTDDDSQWFDNIIDGTGTHYTFAALDQQTVSFNTRMSYTMSPTLTLQVYASPFMTRGTYSNVRETSATPRAAEYENRYQPYTVPAGTDMGFNFKQLRSNTVMRWEYRPGSTLFVVWTHGRDAFFPLEGNRSWRQEYDNLFEQHPDNTFLVKLAYWLSR
jgi:hypothetical protein